MRFQWTLLILPLIVSLLPMWSHSALASETIVIAEGRYLMGDSDTLIGAEERVLQRAQRKAVEEAGLYIESTFLDREKSEAGRSLQISALEIRTIAGAITKTEILESHRTFENGRPSFYVRIRAVVDLDSLKTAVQKWHSEQRLAEHYRRLQKENIALKTQLETLKISSAGCESSRSIPSAMSIETKHKLKTCSKKRCPFRIFPEARTDLSSSGIGPQSIAPLILRGQTYLTLASIAYSNKTRPSEYSEYIDNARMDFDRALLIAPTTSGRFSAKATLILGSIALKRPSVRSSKH